MYIRDALLAPCNTVDVRGAIQYSGPLPIKLLHATWLCTSYISLQKQPTQSLVAGSGGVCVLHVYTANQCTYLPGADVPAPPLHTAAYTTQGT